MVEPTAGTELRGPERVARNFEHGALHDPEQARAQGFRGALVGVAYNLWHPSALFEDHLRERWLEQGRLQIRFVGPVYEGDELHAEATLEGTGDDFAASWRVANQDGATVIEGHAGWAPQHDPAPAPDEAGSDDPAELIDLHRFTLGERIEATLETDAAVIEEYCRRNEDPRAAEDRIPFSYLATMIFRPVRDLLDERGFRGGMFGTLDIRVHRRLRRGTSYDYAAQVIGLRRRGQLEFIDLELRAYEAGALACAVTQTHIIPHRDHPPAGDGAPGASPAL